MITLIACAALAATPNSQESPQAKARRIHKDATVPEA